MPPRGSSSRDTERDKGSFAGRRTTAVVVSVAALALSAGSASASSTGGSGGAVYVAKPAIGKVQCIRRCASRRRARAGSTLKIVGRNLGSVRVILFRGSSGRADDVQARVRPRSERRIQLRVPMGAVSGPVAAMVSRRLRSHETRPISILPPPPPTPNPELSPVPGPRQRGAPRVETGTSSTRAFYGSLRTVVFSFRVTSKSPVRVQVELVSARTGLPIRTWAPAPVEPGTVRSIVWTGTAGAGPAAPGRYSFVLTAQGANGAIARSSQAQDYQRDAFDLYDNIFPLRARHDFGSAGARFGAARAGHSHQGQDVFARCGKPIVAARGGRVKAKAYHSVAGNYLVIHGAETDLDYVYMHLADPSPFVVGDRVYTGQQIGAVGQTGNAHGCHLHFELWHGGWYGGGAPFDPLPLLLAWDAWS